MVDRWQMAPQSGENRSDSGSRAGAIRPVAACGLHYEALELTYCNVNEYVCYFYGPKENGT